jgi:hypothetical protein
MDLDMARLCLDCEEIFQGKSRCPKCDGKFWHPIIGWIKPMGEVDRSFVRREDALFLTKRDRRELLIGTAA